MAERPIIFSAPMVRAILADRKTMTRRLATSPLRKCEPGDLLWVRETIATHGAAEPLIYAKGDGHPWGSPIYRATFTGGLLPECEGFTKWRPSIHMPRWASRITLRVTSVKIERLQDISEEDAKGEGVEPVVAGRAGWSDPIYSHRTGFVRLWNELHGAGAWLANPEVVAISFAREFPS